MAKPIKVFIRAAKKTVVLRMQFEQHHTVFDIKKAYCDQEGGKKSPEKFNLRYQKNGTKLLQPDYATMEQLKIKRMLKLTITAKLNGGADDEKHAGNILNSNRKDRKLDKSDPDIKLSNKECCVYRDKQGERAEAPCGHAFTPYSMFDTLKALLRKNDYEYIIKCPACGKAIDFDLCATIANLNDKEYEFFIDELGKRSSPETAECPDCGIDCERPEKLTMMRVNCSACSGGDWCFLCAKLWKGGGFTVCGNKDCELYDINKILNDCDIKPASKTSYGVEIPEIRACPNCLEFIEHDDACKHMTCDGCGHNFCFVCLKPKNKDGSWPCGTHRKQCIVAPRQKF